MSQPELLPCPFCGHTEIAPHDVCGETAFFVCCPGCEATGGPPNLSPSGAIKAWNIRYQPELRPIVIAQHEESDLRETVANLAATIEQAIKETRANTHEIQKLQRQLNT